MTLPSRLSDKAVFVIGDLELRVDSTFFFFFVGVAAKCLARLGSGGRIDRLIYLLLSNYPTCAFIEELIYRQGL